MLSELATRLSQLATCSKIQFLTVINIASQQTGGITPPSSPVLSAFACVNTLHSDTKCSHALINQLASHITSRYIQQDSHLASQLLYCHIQSSQSLHRVAIIQTTLTIYNSLQFLTGSYAQLYSYAVIMQYTVSMWTCIVPQSYDRTIASQLAT